MGMGAESSRVRGRGKFEESAWKVCGKFEGMGVESARKVAGVMWACKVREKCVESWRVWAWNVRGKLEGVGVRKFIAGTRGGGGLCKVNGKVKAWDRNVLGNVEGVAGKCVGNCLWVCELALTG